MRLFLALLALWLVLNESLAPGQVLLGAALALGGVAVYSRLQPPANRVRNRPGAALRLLGLVVADIVRSNLAVARIVLGLGRGAAQRRLPRAAARAAASRRAGGDRLHHHRHAGHQLGALRQPPPTW